MTKRTDLAINWNLDPRLLTVAASSAELTIQDLVDTCRSIEDSTVGDQYPYLLDAVGKEAIGGGVQVGITVTANNMQIAFASRTGSVSSGTATSADANGETLVDTAATFVSDGVTAGAAIINLDDGSVASVLSVDSEIQITHEPLSDGVGNDWQIGDSYKVWNWTLCELVGGNATAADGGGAPIDALQPRFGVSYVRTSSASATLQETEGGVQPDEVWSEVVEGSYTYAEFMRIMFSVMAGLTSGSGTEDVRFRDLADSKDRVQVTLDEQGNRIAIVKLDGT